MSFVLWCLLRYHVVVYRSTTAAGTYLMCIHSVSSWIWLLHRMSVPSGKWFMWCELLIPHRVQRTGSSRLCIFILFCFRSPGFCSKTSLFWSSLFWSLNSNRVLIWQMQLNWFSIPFFSEHTTCSFFITNWTQTGMLFSSHWKSTINQLKNFH